MFTCANRLIRPAWLLLGLFILSQPALAAAVETPYSAVSLPFELHQVANTPAYYIVGESGVPGADNEGPVSYTHLRAHET